MRIGPSADHASGIPSIKTIRCSKHDRFCTFYRMNETILVSVWGTYSKAMWQDLKKVYLYARQKTQTVFKKTVFRVVHPTNLNRLREECRWSCPMPKILDNSAVKRGLARNFGWQTYKSYVVRNWRLHGKMESSVFGAWIVGPYSGFFHPQRAFYYLVKNSLKREKKMESSLQTLRAFLKG